MEVPLMKLLGKWTQMPPIAKMASSAPSTAMEAHQVEFQCQQTESQKLLELLSTNR